MKTRFSFSIATSMTATLLAAFFLASAAQAETVRRPGLIKPRKELFNHTSHAKPFEKLGVQCTDCHSFAIKPATPGPVGTPAKKAVLRDVVQMTCHECHLGKVSVPLRKNCLLCHTDLGVIKPQDHYQSWKLRHGKLAQADQDSCNRCHNAQDCTGCHAKQNTLNQLVHRPNFRMTHSIQARAEPRSCTVCHKSAAFCMDCHSGRRK